MSNKEIERKLEETHFVLKLNRKQNFLNIYKAFFCFSILMISFCLTQQSWSAAFPDELIAENLFNEQTFRTLAQREDLEDEDELDRLATIAHGEEDGRSMVSGMTALSIASSQFYSTDKAEIARKLQTRIGRLHGEATVIIRNRKFLTVELEEAEDIDPLKNAALRLTFERSYPEILWQENTLVIPWESLVDTHVRHFQRDFNAAEASVRRQHQVALEAQLEQLRGEQQRAQISRNPRLALLGPIIRRDTDFENTGQNRLGGSSYSSGVFRERGTGDLWLGKSDPRMATAEALEVNEAQTESEVSREKLSCDIYAYYGAVVPRTELSRQRLTNTAFPEHRELYAVHLMSHLIEGFHSYTEQQDFDLSHPNRGGHLHIPYERGTFPIPEKGLGTILAIAAFINDVDVIAGGGNIGYQLLHTEQGAPYAQTVKIDSGAAFNNNPEITVLPRFIRTALQAEPSSLSFERLPPSTQEEFLLTLYQINRTTERELILFFTREGAEKFVLRDERGVQGIVNQLLGRQERLRQEYALDLERTRGIYERLQAQQGEEEQERLRLVNLRQQDIDAADHRRVEEQARLRMRVEDLTRDQCLQQQRLQQAQRVQAEERERAERERAESQAQLGHLQQNLQELQRHLPTEREARLSAERDVERLHYQIQRERLNQERIQQEQRTQADQARRIEEELAGRRGPFFPEVQLGSPKLREESLLKIDPSDLFLSGKEDHRSIKIMREVDEKIEKLDREKQAADQGNASAQFNLGDRYEKGRGVPRDDQKAVEWYQKAAKQGFSRACIRLGDRYENGWGVLKDEETALKLYVKVFDLDQKDENTQFSLGWMYANGRGVRKDDVKAVEWFQKAAEQGQAEAQYALGVMYANGRGVEKDDVKAVEWYQKAADQGQAEAQYKLGGMYATGRGIRKDEAKAVEWYQKAANQGDAIAQCKLGGMYANGRGVEKDDVKAVEWFQKAADQGNADAQCALGGMYANGKDEAKYLKWYQKAADPGRGVRKDEVKAVEWYQKAADQGNTDSQVNLGFMYENGRGVPQDDRKAVEWYQKAAEQGNAEAQSKLGGMYDTGRGVRQDETKALEWYQKAADQGQAEAQCAIGMMYETGRGVRQDDVEAVELYQRAAYQGNAEAQSKLGGMYETGRGVLKDEAKAIQWFQKAAGQRNANAQYKLGVMYENGRGVRKDEEKAVEWYQEAAYRDHVNAQCALGRMYENGKDGFGDRYETDRRVRKDEAKAVEWYQKAAKQGNANAQYKLGMMYYNGRGVRQDEAKAVEWYQKSAYQGNAESQYKLGVMYETGRGVRKNEAKAVEWYQKAADQGNADAQSGLGGMYANGRGVRQDDVKAVELYQQAADQGNAEAQCALGDMYANGRGVRQNDVKKAVEWWQKAAKQGNRVAQSNLNQLNDLRYIHFLSNILR